jgi:hypothetical protein
LLIGAISAFDLTLAVKYATVSGGLVFFKMMGTIAILGGLVFLFSWRRNIAEIVAWIVCLIQIFLFTWWVTQ